MCLLGKPLPWHCLPCTGPTAQRPPLPPLTAMTQQRPLTALPDPSLPQAEGRELSLLPGSKPLTFYVHSDIKREMKNVAISEFSPLEVQVQIQTVFKFFSVERRWYQ